MWFSFSLEKIMANFDRALKMFYLSGMKNIRVLYLAIFMLLVFHSPAQSSAPAGQPITKTWEAEPEKPKTTYVIGGGAVAVIIIVFAAKRRRDKRRKKLN